MHCCIVPYLYPLSHNLEEKNKYIFSELWKKTLYKQTNTLYLEDSPLKEMLALLVTNSLHERGGVTKMAPKWALREALVSAALTRPLSMLQMSLIEK